MASMTPRFPISRCRVQLLRPGSRTAWRGFTLLELLMVLALVALVTGLVAPRALAWLEGARERAELDRLHSRLAVQPLLAFHAGQARVFAGPPADWPVPAGWRLEFAGPLRWEANGMSAPGRVRVWSGPDLLADWVVVTPGGELRAAAPADGPFRAEERRP